MRPKVAKYYKLQITICSLSLIPPERFVLFFPYRGRIGRSRRIHIFLQTPFDRAAETILTTLILLVIEIHLTLCGLQATHRSTLAGLRLQSYLIVIPLLAR